MNKEILRAATFWQPEKDDEVSDIQKMCLEYLLKEALGEENAKPIDKVIDVLGIAESYSKKAFQHKILVPLKNQRGFFIGSGRSGIFLVSSGEDFIKAYDFYVERINSETRHLRNIKILAEQTKIFADFNLGKESKKRYKKYQVYFDESGSPDINSNDRFFILTAVIFNKKNTKFLDEKMAFIKTSVLNWQNPDDELKASKLKKDQIELVCRELATIDFEVFSICFDKVLLQKKAFSSPKHFYFIAFKKLIHKILDYPGLAELYFDQYGDLDSSFKSEFEEFVRINSTFYPKDKISIFKQVDSRESNLIQIADLVCGLISKRFKKKLDYLSLLSEKIVELEVFPYDHETIVP